MEKDKNVYNIIRYLVKTLIYSRLWIAFCTFCFTQVSFILFSHRTDISVYSVLLALGSYVLYVLPFLYYGFKGIIRASNPRQLWVEEKLKRLYATTAVITAILAVMGFFYFDLFVRMAINGFVVVLVTVLYMLPLIPWKGRFYALRQWGMAKPFLLTFVWWYMGAYLVAAGKADEVSCFVTRLTASDIFLLVFQFVFMLLLCIIFDIRDYDNDSQNGIKTWPVLTGIKNTQRIVVIISIMAIITVLFSPVLPAFKVHYYIVFGIIILFNLKNLQHAPWWFYDVAIDGLMVAQWALLLLSWFFA